MFTLLVCLVVVVVSGAAVIRVTMGGAVKPATQPSTGQGQGRSRRDEEPRAESPAHDEVAGDDGAADREAPGHGEAPGSDTVGEGDETGVPAPAATASAALRAAQATPQLPAGAVATDTLERHEPETAASSLPRGREAGVRRPRVAPQRGWRRLRSVVLLAVVLAMIGALLALMVGLAVTVFSLGLRDAVTS